MKKIKLSKPQFLSLEPEAKQKIIFNINNANLDSTDKQIAEECMLFTEYLQKKLQHQSTTLQQIKNLFEIYLKKVQAI